MKVRTEKIYITLTVPRAEVEAYEGPYFYDKGLAMEQEVQEKEVKNAVAAQFDGFEVLSELEQQHVLEDVPEEPAITAKLFYYVDIQSN
ncbi:MAG TPA: hypothetical protein H9825_14265 [Candidatus Sphingobacterium stercorigallinarum]|nr:hypothetical protein [Candidatus Sphingobacterium stercorigallinarum]